MFEFTDREKKIIHTMNVLRNPQLSNVSPQTKKNLVIMALNLRNIKFDEKEIIDISYAITNEVNSAITDGLAFLDKHKESLEALKHLKL